MSSTNRGRERNRADNYPTPGWCVKRFLEAVPLPGGYWLEPCAGTGDIIHAVGLRTEPTHWTAFEIRPETQPSLMRFVPHERIFITDFLKLDLSQEAYQTYHVAITNPPFSLALPFIERCLYMAQHTVMLLRLNFVASEGRAEFMRKTKPDIYVLPNRPPFIEVPKFNKLGQVKYDSAGNVMTKKATDSIEYAWFHWHHNSQGILRVLNTTPASERK